MKSCPDAEQELFNEGPLDRALDIITTLKKDTRDIKPFLEVQRASLVYAGTMLREVKDTLFQMGQNDLFQENGIDCGDDFEQLKAIIGEERAARVVELFAGSTFCVPKSLQTMENYRAIRQEYKDGANYRALSIKYGYTETHIRRIIHTKRTKNEKA
jgi:hypothetical protein